MWRMDYAYKNGKGVERDHLFKGDVLPSDFWRSNVFYSFQEDDVWMGERHILGVDTVMWGSDYPHPDGIWPDSRDFIKRELGDVASATRRKVICDNAAKLYRLQ